MNIVDGYRHNPPKQLWFEVNHTMCYGHQWLYDTQYTIVLIHGAIANNRWWQHIGHSLVSGNILSLDLSGHGLSAWESSYHIEKHAKQVQDLIKYYAQGRVYLIGHSYGGAVAALAASQMTTEKVVLVDTPLTMMTEDQDQSRRYQKMTYPTAKSCIKRFRALPPQPVINPDILNHIAAHSYKKVADGFTWQFDPKLNKRAINDQDIKAIQSILPNALFWYGEHSPFATTADLVKAQQLGLHCHEVKNAYHAVMVDNPERVIQLIQGLVEV